jgi:hypothetical protein
MRKVVSRISTVISSGVVANNQWSEYQPAIGSGMSTVDSSEIAASK